MNDSGTVNSQVVDSIAVAQQATLSTDTVRASGAGKAYQSVAQSTAIAVQDAADNLRNVMTVSTTAIGAAMAELIATGEPQYVEAIEQANQVVVNAANHFKDIGESAAQILNTYPSQ